MKKNQSSPTPIVTTEETLNIYIGCHGRACRRPDLALPGLPSGRGPGPRGIHPYKPTRHQSTLSWLPSLHGPSPAPSAPATGVPPFRPRPTFSHLSSARLLILLQSHLLRRLLIASKIAKPDRGDMDPDDESAAQRKAVDLHLPRVT